MNPVREVAALLAVWRATRLLQRDDVWPLPELREKVLARYGASRWSILLDCPGCLSVWVAAAMLLLRSASPRLHDALCRVLAGSAVVVLLSEWMERREADTTGG